MLKQKLQAWLGLSLRKQWVETSLVVQWLRLCTFNAGGLGSIPGQGTRFHMHNYRCHVLQEGLASSTTKTWHRQINKQMLKKKKETVNGSKIPTMNWNRNEVQSCYSFARDTDESINTGLSKGWLRLTDEMQTGLVSKSFSLSSQYQKAWV